MEAMIDGGKIKSLREALGWTQAELARRSHVRQPTIASIEAGTQRTSRALPRIAISLGVDVSDLDPDCPAALSDPRISALDPESALTAFEVMMSIFRRDLSPEDLQALARVFLDLALEPRDEEIDIPLADQMRLRAQLLVRRFLQKYP